MHLNLLSDQIANIFGPSAKVKIVVAHCFISDKSSMLIQRNVAFLFDTLTIYNNNLFSNNPVLMFCNVVSST